MKNNHQFQLQKQTISMVYSSSIEELIHTLAKLPSHVFVLFPGNRLFNEQWLILSQPAGEQLLQFLFRLQTLTTATSLRRKYSVTGQHSQALVQWLTRVGHRMICSREKRMLGRSTLLVSGNLQISKVKHERAPMQTQEKP